MSVEKKPLANSLPANPLIDSQASKEDDRDGITGQLFGERRRKRLSLHRSKRQRIETENQWSSQLGV